MQNRSEENRKKILEEILADHLLNFYLEYAEAARSIPQHRILNRTNKIALISFTCFTLAGALAGGILGALGAATIFGLLFGFITYFLIGGTVGALISYFPSMGMLLQAEKMVEELNKKKIIGERLLEIDPTEALEKMRELAKFLIDEQLSKEHPHLEKVNLYKVASHAIAGLKKENARCVTNYAHLQQAMLAGVKEEKPLFSANLWFWIKCAFMKLKQKIQLAIYDEETVETNPRQEQSDSTLYFQPLDDEQDEHQQVLETEITNSNSSSTHSSIGRNRSCMFSHSSDEIISVINPTINFGPSGN